MWYFGEAGKSCDTTCKHFGMNNLAGYELFDDGALEGDCSMIDHFLDQVERKSTTPGDTNYFNFGYFYTDTHGYYCATKGNDPDGSMGNRVGVLPGNPVRLVPETRRLICPCNRI